MKLKQEDFFYANCEETCSKSEIKIYGDMTYSQDSSICKAAFHSGSLATKISKIKVIIHQGLDEYKASNKMGVNSYTKTV